MKDWVCEVAENADYTAGVRSTKGPFSFVEIPRDNLGAQCIKLCVDNETQCVSARRPLTESRSFVVSREVRDQTRDQFATAT